MKYFVDYNNQLYRSKDGLKDFEILVQSRTSFSIEKIDLLDTDIKALKAPNKPEKDVKRLFDMPKIQEERAKKAEAQRAEAEKEKEKQAEIKFAARLEEAKKLLEDNGLVVQVEIEPAARLEEAKKLLEDNGLVVSEKES